MIPVFRPALTEKELEKIKEVLDSRWWGCGPKTKEFEQRFGNLVGMPHAVGLNSCTAALHLAGKVLNLPAGSEVITTPMTFISTSYLALYNNLKPVFADIEEDTLNIDPEDIRKKITDKTKVILPVHYGGQACRMKEIMDIAAEHKLIVVEDCAHAAGGAYKGKPLGSFGDLSCFSFHAVKNLPMGDGGILLTKSEEHSRRAQALRWVGINKDTAERTDKEIYSWEYMINEIGWKYQMNDLAASIGLAQLDYLEEFNEKRRKIAGIYDEAFAGTNWIKPLAKINGAKSAQHNYVVKVEKDRNQLMKHLKQREIHTSVHYMPVYKYPLFKGTAASCPVTESVWQKIVTLPLYPEMSEDDVKSVVEAVKSFK